MSVLFVALPVALMIGAMAVGAFVWSVRTGQFDDLDTPSRRILFDDRESKSPAFKSRELLNQPTPNKTDRPSVSNARLRSPN